MMSNAILLPKTGSPSFQSIAARSLRWLALILFTGTAQAATPKPAGVSSAGFTFRLRVHVGNESHFSRWRMDLHLGQYD
jgi:hypothetical protein